MLGETRVGIYAKRDLPKDTELSFDYQVTLSSLHSIVACIAWSLVSFSLHRRSHCECDCRRLSSSSIVSGRTKSPATVGQRGAAGSLEERRFVLEIRFMMCRGGHAFLLVVLRSYAMFHHSMIGFLVCQVKEVKGPSLKPKKKKVQKRPSSSTLVRVVLF